MENVNNNIEARPKRLSVEATVILTIIAILGIGVIARFIYFLMTGI